MGLSNHTYYEDGEYTEYQEAGQTFKASMSTSLATIQFYISRFDYAGTVDVQIYSCSSQNSWGSLLNTKTNVPITASGWVSVDVSDLAIAVIADNYYGFKLIPGNDLAAGIGINSNLYADGQGWVSNGGGYESFNAGQDYPFTVTGNSTLPVELILFTAQKQGKNALLQWSTANERNSMNFVIQHSIDGNVWTNIATIQASGNSNDTRSYGYVHTGPVNGDNYYRLMQADIDGKFSYSEIKQLKFTSDAPVFTIITNPVSNGVLQIRINNATNLSFYSADGKLLWQKKYSAGIQNISTYIYPNGMYMVKGNNCVEKILIQ